MEGRQFIKLSGFFALYFAVVQDSRHLQSCQLAKFDPSLPQLVLPDLLLKRFNLVGAGGRLNVLLVVGVLEEPDVLEEPEQHILHDHLTHVNHFLLHGIRLVKTFIKFSFSSEKCGNFSTSSRLSG